MTLIKVIRTSRFAEHESPSHLYKPTSPSQIGIQILYSRGLRRCSAVTKIWPSTHNPTMMAGSCGSPARCWLGHGSTAPARRWLGWSAMERTAPGSCSCGATRAPDACSAHARQLRAHGGGGGGTAVHAQARQRSSSRPSSPTKFSRFRPWITNPPHPKLAHVPRSLPNPS